MIRDDALLADWRDRALALEAHAAQVVIGQARVIRLVNTAVFARGHVLLQGDVGVGKTTLLRAFARLIGGRFARAEGTIDLMPNDLIYHTHIGSDGRPAIDPGPLTEHGDDLALFFFNEINRARPQVHALLLRVMAERSLNAFNRELKLPHLLVFADRNRLEREETFEIASAARDRFMFEVTIDAPTLEADRRTLMFDARFHDTDGLIDTLPEAILPHRELGLVAGVIQRSIHASPALQDYALALWRATGDPGAFGIRLDAHHAIDLHDADLAEVILAGCSPRGMSQLMRAARVTAWLEGRDHATPDDVRAVFAEAVAHRLCLQPVYELQRDAIVGALVQGMLDHVAAP
ncbi:MAG: AAA family ATPase [Leptothrix sp. (in: b-proteobacteria)]